MSLYVYPLKLEKKEEEDPILLSLTREITRHQSNLKMMTSRDKFLSHFLLIIIIYMVF
jgi:hypothetical protein